MGHTTPPVEGLPDGHGRGRFANDEGRILPGLYCVGWARRGPTGTIGTNRPDGYMIAEKIGADIGKGDNKAGRPGLDALLAERQGEIVTFRPWQTNAAADCPSPRYCPPPRTVQRIEELN